MITVLQKVAERSNMCISQDLHLLYQLRNNKTWLNYITYASRDPHILWNLSDFFSDVTISWLVVLAQKRVSYSSIKIAISTWFAQNSDDFEIKCVTATNMSAELRIKLESEIYKKYPKNKITYEINEGIYGGIQLIFNKYIIDNSLKAKFQRFQAECRAIV
jgi:hypothetical protein